MSDAKDKTDKPEAPAAPKKKSKLVPILLTVVIVVIAGGGGAGAYWFFSQRSAAAPAAEGGEEAKAPEPEEAPTPGMVEMEPFVVNLADAGGQRFVRISMKLLTWNEPPQARQRASRRRRHLR